jgi:division protein CdvB (Snf7/Vps24/ESCRT-III family)
MRDKTHAEQVERWAEHVKNNQESWKKELKPFLDSQIIIARRFYKELAKTQEGREKIKLLRRVN